MELTENKVLDCECENEKSTNLETIVDDKIVFTKENMLKALNDIAGSDLTITETENGTRIKVADTIFMEELKDVIDTINNYERQDTHENILLDLKGMSEEKLAFVFKYAMTLEDLSNPLLILNIINLIKVYNTLEDSHFANEDIYFTSIENMLDVRLEISSEIAEFTKKIALIFVSLFKSYNKFVYTPADKPYRLPKLYKTIILSCDLLTLSGIFMTSDNFDTSECMFIEDSLLYISSLITKSSMSFELIEMFLKDRGEKDELKYQ